MLYIGCGEKDELWYSIYFALMSLRFLTWKIGHTDVYFSEHYSNFKSGIWDKFELKV